MKVAIVKQYHNRFHYGHLLQSYALTRAVGDLDGVAHCRQVKIKTEATSALQKLEHMFRKRGFFAAFMLLFNMGTQMGSGKFIKRKYAKRLRGVEAFHHDVIPHSEVVYSAFNARESLNDYDIFITGGDHVWRSRYDGLQPMWWLDFVPSTKKKISYAASVSCDGLTEEEAEKVADWLADYHAISLKERHGRELIQGIVGETKNVHHAIDPTLLLSRDEWDEICSERKVSEKYIFAYLLGLSRKQRKFVMQFAKSKNMKVVTLPYVHDHAFHFADLFFGDFRPSDTSPEDFISLIKHAEYVFTDAFHGTIFSAIYQKDFYVFRHDQDHRIHSCVHDLLQTFSAEHRLINASDGIGTLSTIAPIDYAITIKNIDALKKDSLAFLQNALYSDLIVPKPQKPTSKSKSQCSACHACVSACPHESMAMSTDDEGFLYPVIHEALCTHCGICSDVCPFKVKEGKTNTPAAYAAYVQDEALRKISSSGGMFGYVAEQIIGRGGVVFGCKLNDTHEAIHAYTETLDGLPPFYGSKYVQSVIGKSFQQVKAFLAQGREVLFVGTPCQVEGLHAYLGKNYDHLYLVDFICHGVPSPKFWGKYVAYRTAKAGSPPQKISFRQKDFGWKLFSMSFSFENDTKYLGKLGKDPYLAMFLADYCLRPSCYSCKTKSVNRVSDLTLADFWGAGAIDPKLDDDQGLSLLLVHSDKGEQMLRAEGLWRVPVDFSKAIKHNRSYYASAGRPPERSVFLTEIDDVPLNTVFKKYHHPNQMRNITLFPLKMVWRMLKKVMK